MVGAEPSRKNGGADLRRMGRKDPNLDRALARPPAATYRLRRQQEGDLIRVGLSLAAAVWAGALCTARAAEPSAQTLYRHAILIDGTGASERAGMSVLVEGERI